MTTIIPISKRLLLIIAIMTLIGGLKAEDLTLKEFDGKALVTSKDQGGPIGNATKKKEILEGQVLTLWRNGVVALDCSDPENRSAFEQFQKIYFIRGCDLLKDRIIAGRPRKFEVWKEGTVTKVPGFSPYVTNTVWNTKF
jgi:hypothetical protein